MVDKFYPTPVYPGSYDPRRWASNQSAVPSQNAPVPDPFYPDPSVDLQSPPSGGRPKVAGTDNRAIVRSVYDSRPPYAFDFVFTDKFVGGAAVFGGFAVPVGYVAVVRKIEVILSGNKSVGGNGLISPYGDISNQLLIPQLRVSINGGQQAQWLIPTSQNSPSANPIAGFAGNLIPGAIMSGAEIDTFFVLGENDTLNISVPGWTDTIGLDVDVAYGGQLILTDGRLKELEIGNSDAEPVTVE